MRLIIVPFQFRLIIALVAGVGKGIRKQDQPPAWVEALASHV